MITDEATACKQVRWKPNRELARAGEGIESPYDIEARYRSRYGIGRTGYMVHLSETCDSDQCHLITNVMTTTAAVHEAKCTQDIHQSLINKQLPPDEHFVDLAYVDAQLLIQAQEQGITLVGPTRPDVSWQARADGAFDLTQFEYELKFAASS